MHIRFTTPMMGNIMINRALFGFAILVLSGAYTAAIAQDSIIVDNKNSTKPIGRYTMTPAPNGFLRLDTRSGAVSLCTLNNGNVRCQSSADERAALEAEIARLSRKNAMLEKKLAQSGKPITKRLRDALPTDAEMDKALSIAEKIFRRMMRVIKEEAPKQDRT